MSGDKRPPERAVLAYEQEAKRAYAIVGELVLITSTLDHQLNRICIPLLGLIASPLLEPVLATLDSARKIELLKIWASKLKAKDWREAVKKHAEAVEGINKTRNIAAHGQMSFDNGQPVFHLPSAAKLLRAIDMSSKKTAMTNISMFEQTIRKSEEILGKGEKLISKLNDVAQERGK